MDNQLKLFPDETGLYQVKYYFGILNDTNGNEIAFVRTIKTGLTKFAADKLAIELNNNVYSDCADYYKVTKQ